MIDDKKLETIGELSFPVPSIVIILPYFFHSQSKLHIIPLSIPELILFGWSLITFLTPLVIGFWLIINGLNIVDKNGKIKGWQIFLGILNLLTLPWLFILWLVVGVMSFGMRFGI